MYSTRIVQVMLLVFSTVLSTSCLKNQNEEDLQTSVSFNFVLPEEDSNKKAGGSDIWGNGVSLSEVASCDDLEVSYLRVILRPKGAADDSEDMTFELEVFKQEGKIYSSEALQLPNNRAYDILSFVIYDVEDAAVLATPLIGSQFENFVNTPIGIGAEHCIPANRKRKEYLGMEVLCCEFFEAPNFGYVYYYTKVINMRTLCLKVLQCRSEDKKGRRGKHKHKYKCADFGVMMWYAKPMEAANKSGDKQRIEHWEKGKALFAEDYAPRRSGDDECALCFKYPDREGKQYYWMELLALDGEGELMMDEVLFQGVVSDEELLEIMHDEGKATVKLECEYKEDKEEREDENSKGILAWLWHWMQNHDD